MDEITWNEVICLIDRIVHEIRMALSHELHLSALALALTLPDTCGKAEYPNEDYNGVRYKNWCKDTLEDKVKRLMRDDVRAANF